ncbi:MAG TPA: hypothetical protein VH765_10310 [Xanthobacteraceae bacterium]|jgi:hypothetical protein
MSTRVKITATAVAATFAFASLATPASAYIRCHPKVVPSAHSSSPGFLLPCIMGSAGGLILASIVKGGGIKWMSQKEWEDLKVKVPNPLTNDEAALIAFTCGIGAIPVIANFKKQQPAVVKARG